MSTLSVSPPAALAVSSAPLHRLGRAAVGFAAFGLCAALGLGDALGAMKAAPALAGVALGPALITGPSLLVAHQLVDMGSEPAEVVRTVAEGFFAAGDLSLGLAPVALFFAATTSLAGVGLIAGTALIGLVGLLRTGGALVRLENRTDAGISKAGTVVVLAWMGLTGAIGLRLLASFARGL